MFKKLIIIFILIGSLEVYNLSILGNTVRLFHLAAIGLMVSIIVIDLVYFKTIKLKQNFSAPIYFIFLGVLLSMFSAYYSYNQTFALSLYAQRDIYFYLVYFILHILKIEKKALQRLILYFGILYLLLYLIQFVAFPTTIFDVHMLEDRNTIRIVIQGSGYSILAYFMCLQIFYSSNNFKYLILALVLLIPTILFGARSGMLTILMGTVAQLLFSKRIKSKAMVITLVLAALIPAYYFSQDIINGMIMASEADSAKGSDYVRIRAAQFYLTQFMPTDISMITGVGAPTERSPLGQMTAMISKRYHFNLSDVGIISNFVTYGIFFIFGLLWTLYKTMFLKIKHDMLYVKYFLFFLVLLMIPIAAGYAYSAAIAELCCIFYQIDISSYEYKSEIKSLQNKTLTA